MTKKVAAKLEPDSQSEDETPDPPFFGEVKEFVRNLVIAEKNYGLYPVHGKVAQHSLNGLYTCLCKLQAATDAPLRLEVAQFDVVYQGKAVYHEENMARSLAYRMYKDSVREVVFLKDIKKDEVADFLSCFRESRLSDEEDDFSALFWEKDCTNIQIEAVNDFLEEDGSENIPQVNRLEGDLELDRFTLGGEEEEELLKALQDFQLEKPEGDGTFELSELEIKQFQQLTAEEEKYFPSYDFVDILIELMARNRDPKAFEQVILCIRTLIFSLIEQFEFERAHRILKKLTDERLRGLTDTHRFRLQELAKSLCDKPAMGIIADFLKENAELPKGHAVFDLMRTLPRDAVPHFCELLKIPQHISAVVNVLMELGAGWGGVFSQYLMNPDPVVVRAMIQVLVKTEKHSPVDKIAPALKHPLEAVRSQAAVAMLQLNDRKAGQFLIPLLSDRSKSLVCIALQFFNKTPSPQAAKSLALLIGSRMFPELDAARKEQCFHALLLAIPESAVKFISRQVIGWGFCLGKQAFERKAAALRSLKAHPSEEGLQLLKKLASRRRRRLSRTAQEVIEKLEVARAPVEETAKETQSA